MLAYVHASISKLFIFANCEKGATMVEYGLLVAVIAMVVVIGAIGLGAAIGVSFCDMAQDLDPTAIC